MLKKAIARLSKSSFVKKNIESNPLKIAEKLEKEYAKEFNKAKVYYFSLLNKKKVTPADIVSKAKREYQIWEEKYHMTKINYNKLLNKQTS